MNLLLLSLALLGCAVATPTFNGENFATFPAFQRFVQKFGRKYEGDEFIRRFKIFHENFKMVEELQRMERGSAIYGMNQFADLTAEEFRAQATMRNPMPEAMHTQGLAQTPSGATPTAFDWRDQGAVTPVKNQQQCGSCWAFSTTGNIEGQWFIKKGALISLSEQELVDCDHVDQGCDGGLPSQAYQQIMLLGGLTTEANYPYTARGGSCSFTKNQAVVYINSSVVISSDEGEMATWLAANGPISIGINAAMMQFYMGGVAHPWKILCNPNKLDHGVLIVGYGVEGTKPYWIIKNSWGPTWGEKGYYRIYRGDGSCGVNKMPTSAVVN